MDERNPNADRTDAADAAEAQAAKYPYRIERVDTGWNVVASADDRIVEVTNAEAMAARICGILNKEATR